LVFSNPGERRDLATLSHPMSSTNKQNPKMNLAGRLCSNGFSKIFMFL
jgi:hypothetical protein